ncbi:MAG: 4-(cytidine 5'-diphospho)-2-C-methyl-D-erythritol kinase [Fidelibacterota bacterium]
MNPIVRRSFSKINIGLRVLNTRTDGYHNIETVYQELDFSDKIVFKKAADGCHITSNVNWIPVDETNTCHRAYEVLKSHFPELGGVVIRLNKEVPVGAGLGGGSANAAVTLKTLSKIFQLDCSADELVQIGLLIGADVPFFINGGTQVGEGIGDRLTPLNNFVNGVYLLVIPSFSISTAWAYQAVKNILETSGQMSNFARFFSGEISALKIFKNDFEKIVIPAYPEIGTIKQKLLDSGAGFASLSGSGSTVFGIFDDEATAREAESTFKPHYKTVLAHPTN